MQPERRLRFSRFLSLILRHRPDEVGLTLDEEGSVPLDALVAALRRHGGWEWVTEADVLAVAHHDPRRFEVRAGRIRARHGHTVPLQHPGPAVRPPEWLYAALPARRADEVQAGGLRPRERRFVHLVDTWLEAARALERHGEAGLVVPVLARRAHGRGVPFFQASEHLYLTPGVPPDFVLLPARTQAVEA
jgi:putative RNA 2'-phosphotransferase